MTCGQTRKDKETKDKENQRRRQKETASQNKIGVNTGLARAKAVHRNDKKKERKKER